MENLFIQATRKNVLFPTSKGQLNIQQLWQLLNSNEGRKEIDELERRLSEACSKKSRFVRNENESTDSLRWEIVKFIIDTYIKEQENAQAESINRAQAIEEARMLENALANKRAKAMEQMTEEEMERKLQELRNKFK